MVHAFAEKVPADIQPEQDEHHDRGQANPNICGRQGRSLRVGQNQAGNRTQLIVDKGVKANQWLEIAPNPSHRSESYRTGRGFNPLIRRFVQINSV
jgi:hypothetical protein